MALLGRIPAGATLLILLGGLWPDRQIPAFRSVGEGVRIVACVIEKGRLLDKLEQPDFELTDNGVAQEVSVIQSQDSPLDIAVVLPPLHFKRPSTLALLPSHLSYLVSIARADDRLSFHIASAGAVELRRLAPLTAFTLPEGSPFDGPSSLFDATIAALSGLEPQRDDQRLNVLVLLVGSEPDMSWATSEDVRAFADRLHAVVIVGTLESVAPDVVAATGAGVVAFGTKGTGASALPRLLRELVVNTGGRSLNMTAERFQSGFSEAIRQLRSRYILTYVPSGVAPSGWHRVEIKLAKHKRATVISRPGYWARGS